MYAALDYQQEVNRVKSDGGRERLVSEKEKAAFHYWKETSFFVVITLPLASTRWVLMALSSFCPLF